MTTNDSSPIAGTAPEKSPIKHEDIVARIIDKASAHGISDIFGSTKSPERFSSLELALIAERLNTSVHWLITGERDPYEVRLVHCTSKYPFEDEE